MSFESLDFAYHRGVDDKFTYTLCVLSLTSTQDSLQASQFLRLTYNILKKMSQREIVLI